MLNQLEHLLKGGQFAKVRSACESLLEREPNSPLVRHVLGLLNIWTGEIESGSRMLSPAIAKQLAAPENAQTPSLIIDKARNLRALGNYDAAIELLIKCLILSPTHPAALLETGVCLQSQDRQLEAEGFFRASFALDPRNPDAAFGLGMAFLCTGRPANAATFLLKSVELHAGLGIRWRQLAMALIQNSQHEAALRALRTCVDLSPDDSVSLSQQIFLLHYCPSRLQGPLVEAYQNYASKFCPPARRELKVNRGARVRLGYVSGDLKEHPVSFFLEPLLAAHDKSRFELFAYSNTLKEDPTTARLRSRFDHWKDTSSLPDEHLFELIRRDNVDVLVDLSGHTPKNRLRVFAKRAAPVQITMIGTMMTTGVPAMDFRVTDAFLDPEESAGGRPSYGTEAPMRMRAGAVVFSPGSITAQVAPSPAASGAPFTFGSLNDPAKITDETLAVWAEILRLTPESRIILVRRPGNPMKGILTGHGIAEERIIEKDYLPLPQFLEMMQEVDLALDPFPYNGLTITLQSCWMGLPPVTLLGSTPPARAAGMILSRMGLTDFVTTSAAEYVEKAVGHARDPAQLANLRSSMRELVRTNWCDAQEYAKEFEHHILAALDQFEKTAPN